MQWDEKEDLDMIDGAVAGQAPDDKGIPASQRGEAPALAGDDSKTVKVEEPKSQDQRRLSPVAKRVVIVKRSNQLASEKIYEYFSKHAGLHDMDENLFEIKVDKALSLAKAEQKRNLEKPIAAAAEEEKTAVAGPEDIKIEAKPVQVNDIDQKASAPGSALLAPKPAATPYITQQDKAKLEALEKQKNKIDQLRVSFDKLVSTHDVQL